MDKIDIKDLRVGNWVYYNPNVFIEDEYEPTKEIEISQIESGEDIDLIIEDCYAPIPLTEEILEKNFKRYDMDFEISDGFYISRNKSKEGYKLFTLDNLDNSIHLIYLNYVHQLQNLLQDLGIEKEITI